ncbi:MAG: hypothetical protein K9M55_04280 [Candidatus Marinimicrobia bacterium]|nr:hypothetical protein [Candidatus Neomarinimicrobiota bacterium]MCF7921899.1 hypothetical protein [Candidatus Neomarinimicrobiota bacterium]
MKYFVILSLSLGLGFGQSSHRGLCRELLNDLYQVIIDSTSIPADSLHLQFIENSDLATFLSTCNPNTSQSSALSKRNRVDITIEDAILSINHDTENSVRNSRYLRQLELHVLFTYKGNDYPWQGKISDHLSKAQVKSLLADEIPLGISGDYTQDEPAATRIVLTTLAVFSLGAALFFIRT